MQYIVKDKLYYVVRVMKNFKIPAVPATTSKSIRFPNDVIDEVERVIRGKDSTFSAFVIEATRWALESLKEQADEPQDSD